MIGIYSGRKIIGKSKVTQVYTYISKSKFDHFCFWSILLDIFFLPYFSLVSVSYSLPVIVVWYLLRGRKTHACPEYRLFPIVALFMTVCSIMCLLYTGEVLYETTFQTSVKRLLQFLSSFWYFFFLRYYFKTKKTKICNVVFWAIVYMTLLAALYYIFPSQYATIKAVINPADNHTRRWLTGRYISEYRFNFLWSDPNNVGYMAVSLFLFYISEKREDVFKKYAAFFMLVFILFCTMSIGSMLITIFTISLYLTSILWTKRSINARKVGRNVLILTFVALAVFALSGYISMFFDSNIVMSFMHRISIYASSNNVTGGRLNDFERSLTMMNPLFAIIGSGKEGFSAENGHIYLICMYGFPVYCYFMYVLFSKRNGLPLSMWLVILPMFVGFTANIAIIEQKFLLILLCMQAYYSAAGSERYLRDANQRREITGT